MIRFRLTTLVTALSLATCAAAEAPCMATDIPPVKALAGKVMAGIREPELVIRPGTPP